MLDLIFSILDLFTNFVWSYLAIIAIVIVGVYFTVKSRAFQIRKFPAIVSTFFSFLKRRDYNAVGVHPLKAFFASLGGAIGMGNVIVICAAIQLGGPGAALWLWVTGLLGMLLQYAEVYIGIKYRVKNKSGSYDGGPMYFLRKAFRFRWIAIVASVLLCVYGAEVLVFSELTRTFVVNWHLNRYVVVAILLTLILAAGLGGVRRVGELSSAMIPVFVAIFLGMSLWIIFANIQAIPGVFALIFKSAFTGHAPLGGFAGATWLMAMGNGAARGCYSGDIGIGYSSVIHAETSTQRPGRQASLAIFGIFLDTFVICTLSVLVILVTGVWSEPIEMGSMVQAALSHHFPHMQFFMPILFFLLGFTTLTAYFCFGLKAAKYLSPRFGAPIYAIYSSVTMAAFAFIDSTYALIVMTLSGGLLLLINVSAMFKLRHEIRFELEE